MTIKESIMDVKYILSSNQKLNSEQKCEIANASREAITYDEDCPEYSFEDLKVMLRKTNEQGKGRK